MKPFDFDDYYKRLEQASDGEVEPIREELRRYLNDGTPEQRQQRLFEFNEYLRQSNDRLAAEIAFVQELLVTARAA